MSNQLTIQDRVFSIEKDFNQVNAYKMSFAKEAQFALQLLHSNDYLVKAAQSNPAALEYALINIASIGISLNPALKEAYLVPRGGKICLDPSYIGLIKLATDTGAIEWVQAEIVKEKDVFEYQGVGKAPIHKMNPFGDRGQTIGVYCVAKLSSGEFLSTVMSRSECDAIRDKSSQASKSGPWVSFYEEMLKKTVIKRAAKLWPRSERLLNAVEVSNEIDGVDFNASKTAHVDASAYSAEVPTAKDFEFIRARLAIAGRTEAALINSLKPQFPDVPEKIEEFNSAMCEYAKRKIEDLIAKEKTA
jgi:phage RecT family recombinase